MWLLGFGHDDYSGRPHWRLPETLDGWSVKLEIQCILRISHETFTHASFLSLQSTVEFSHSGDYLATGDKGGRVVLFERAGNSKKGCEYKFYTEFQSHEPEFDYLKSLEIEEKINRIRWCRRGNKAHFLLSTNGQRSRLNDKLYCANSRFFRQNYQVMEGVREVIAICSREQLLQRSELLWLP